MNNPGASDQKRGSMMKNILIYYKRLGMESMNIHFAMSGVAVRNVFPLGLRRGKKAEIF